MLPFLLTFLLDCAIIITKERELKLTECNNYVVFHCHTMLSNGTTIMDSVTRFQDYVNEAKKCGMTALAISEHGSVFEWEHK